MWTFDSGKHLRLTNVENVDNVVRHDKMCVLVDWGNIFPKRSYKFIVEY